MLFSIHELRGFATEAIDGPIGRVNDLLFDDQRWVIRYLVIDTGKWLPGRRVLISPISVESIFRSRDTIALHLDKERIRNSPDLDMDAPVSRQIELAFYTYYDYAPYWVGPGMWGPAPSARALRREAGHEPFSYEQDQAQRGDQHLRSAREVSGYHTVAGDGKIGHVEDFVLDDSAWEVRHVAIDTSNWPGGRTVLIPPQWISRIEWSRREVHVNVAVERIRSSAEYRRAELLR